MGWVHYLKKRKKQQLEVCKYFVWIKNIKNMWFAPSDILFKGNLGMDLDRVQPRKCVPALTWNISRSRILPKYCLYIYRLPEKRIANVGKVWFKFHIDFSNLFCFWIFKLINFCFLCILGRTYQYQVDFYFYYLFILFYFLQIWGCI